MKHNGFCAMTDHESSKSVGMDQKAEEDAVAIKADNIYSFDFVVERESV